MEQTLLHQTSHHYLTLVQPEFWVKTLPNWSKFAGIKNVQWLSMLPPIEVLPKRTMLKWFSFMRSTPAKVSRFSHSLATSSVAKSQELTKKSRNMPLTLGMLSSHSLRNVMSMVLIPTKFTDIWESIVSCMTQRRRPQERSHGISLSSSLITKAKL